MNHAQPVSILSRGWVAGRAAVLAVAVLGLLAAPARSPAQDAGVSGIPPGPANARGLNGSINDPSGIGNAARVPAIPPPAISPVMPPTVSPPTIFRTLPVQRAVRLEPCGHGRAARLKRDDAWRTAASPRGRINRPARAGRGFRYPRAGWQMRRRAEPGSRDVRRRNACRARRRPEGLLRRAACRGDTPEPPQALSAGPRRSGQPAEVQALSFNCSIGCEKPRRLASFNRDGETASRLKATFPSRRFNVARGRRFSRSRMTAVIPGRALARALNP